MLDENLPTFFTKPSSDDPLVSTLFLSQNGVDLQPEYVLRRPNPNLPASKNCYALALYDSYNPDVLYAEILVQPEWAQPTLSQSEIRAQNGTTAQPVPIIPNNFTIQLYNPDQQVIVRHIAGTWNSSAHWEFEMPQNSFRLPSASALDRSQSDPAVSVVTPKIAFKWKRDSKLTKDISCYLSGKSTEGRKNKEPDITVAMYKGGKNLTIYQPNMHRVEVEDSKGLEEVLLLSSAVIKDIYFNANREMFNIGSPNATTTATGRARRKSSGPLISTAKIHSPTSPVMSGAVFTSPTTQFPPQQQQIAGRLTSSSNPQTQWEIDAETARLKALVEAEERDRERAEREEEARLKKMLEDEEKERLRREAEIAQETERLKKQYGISAGTNGPPTLQLTSSPSLPPRLFPQYQSAPHSVPPPVQRPLSTPGLNYTYGANQWAAGPSQPPPQNPSPYLQPSGNGGGSSSGFFGLGGGGRNKIQKKKSVFF
jgi:hypothetical protein